MNRRRTRVLAGCAVLAVLIGYLLLGKQPDEIIANHRKAEEAREYARWRQEELDWGQTHVDPKLEKEEADVTNLVSLLNDLVVTNVSIEGQWDSKYWHDGVHLTISPERNGRYNVHYYARGDVGRWRLKRTAFFQAGVLELNKPVKEYTPFTPYKHFYMIQTPAGVRLASQPIVRDWVLGKSPEDWNTSVLNETMLTKQEPNNEPEATR